MAGDEEKQRRERCIQMRAITRTIDRKGFYRDAARRGADVQRELARSREEQRSWKAAIGGFKGTFDHFERN